MLVSSEPKAIAYVNYGRWVADCPAGCNSAAALAPHQPMFNCVECYAIAPIHWPDDADELWEALAARPKPNQNWFPSGHPLALRSGSPDGQTPDELRAETAEHMER